MSDHQLDLIRQYCDTDGVRLTSEKKDLLCRILENPSRYDGFTSELYTQEKSGKDHNGRWSSKTNWQYRINIDSTLSINERYRHSCDDGYIQDDNWEWDDSWLITDVKRIIEILQEIESEL